MSEMKVHKVGIIMNGVTGRMGTNQHLLRSICAIIGQGGVKTKDAGFVLPDPVLVGRDEERLRQLAERAGVTRWTTDLDTALADARNLIYFDAQTSDRRFSAVTKAIEAGKHIYCEKPTALTSGDALALCRLARKAGVKHGVVQDKLWLPGLIKLKELVNRGFFGKILSVRGEFGYWVFEGDTIAPQRPSWNYRREDGGGIIMDMLCHWRYLLDNIVGPVRAVSCRGATHIGRRFDERGMPYECTAEDAAYATFELDGGVIAHFNSSWCTRVRRDDLLTLQVDGTLGSAVVGLRDVWIQPCDATPRAVWNPDMPRPVDYFDSWQRVPDQQEYKNAFKAEWELFLRHVVENEPFPWTLVEGAKGVQLAEKALESWAKRAWVSIPELTIRPDFHFDFGK